MNIFKFRHTNKGAMKIFRMWQMSALATEIVAIIYMIAFMYDSTFKNFGVGMFFLITTLALHMMIQIGDIQLKLNRRARK